MHKKDNTLSYELVFSKEHPHSNNDSFVSKFATY